MSNQRPLPRRPIGTRDLFRGDVVGRRRMIDTIRTVYERYGFMPLETPAFEYVDALGKFLPEGDQPDAGIFALREPGSSRAEWVGLRYDLTAPLARVFAQHRSELPMPYRRYQVGPVWRVQKPGPDSFREFYQFDFDTIGAASSVVDAEVCCVLSDAFEALGIPRGQYLIRVNDRKVLNGVLEVAGINVLEDGRLSSVGLSTLRAIDKLDRLGEESVRELLGGGRKDESGDFTKGAGLTDEQIDRLFAFLAIHAETRRNVCEQLIPLVGASRVGREGVEELEQIDEVLTTLGYGEDRVAFEPSIVRGLEYYTGPVFEAELKFKVPDEKGGERAFGSVAGGGRYDYLVERFLGELIPATGASIGVDRLYKAVSAMKLAGNETIGTCVVVAVLSHNRMSDYVRIAAELRDAGLPSEVYAGSGGLNKQLKYADLRGAIAVVIAGDDEFRKGTVSIKDLRAGLVSSTDVRDRERWVRTRPGQEEVPRHEVVAKVKAIFARQGAT